MTILEPYPRCGRCHWQLVVTGHDGTPLRGRQARSVRCLCAWRAEQDREIHDGDTEYAATLLTIMAALIWLCALIVAIAPPEQPMFLWPIDTPASSTTSSTTSSST